MADVLYEVTCRTCGQTWTPRVRTPLWWQARQRAEEGFLDALRVSPIECGCEEERLEVDAPYRVFGYDDMCIEFDIPFKSLVAAARKYLELERDGGFVVFFKDTRWHGRGESPLEQRLNALAWR